MGDQPKATTTATGGAAGPVPEGDAVMATTNQDALAKGAGDGPAQDAAQEPGQARLERAAGDTVTATEIAT